MKLIEGSTTESLDELKKDIELFIKDDEKEKKIKEESQVDTNPFSALFGLVKKPKDKSDEKDNTTINIKKIKKDSYAESLIRKLSEEEGALNCYTIYDIYKKAHGMAAHDNPYE